MDDVSSLRGVIDDTFAAIDRARGEVMTQRAFGSTIDSGMKRETYTRLCDQFTVVAGEPVAEQGAERRSGWGIPR